MKKRRKLLAMLLAAVCVATSMPALPAAETQAADRENVAFGKPVTANGVVNPDRPASMFTDGIVGNCELNHTDLRSAAGDGAAQSAEDPYYLQVDLKDTYMLDGLHLWRYWKDGRAYEDTVILVSETKDFENPTVVYNADEGNFFGYGAGTEENYNETENGKAISFEPVKARYIRFLANGHSLGGNGHYVEVEAYGELYRELENVALNKPVTVKNVSNNEDARVNSDWPASAITDGVNPDSSDINYCDFVGTDGDEVYVQIDLQANCRITDIHLTRFWGDGRIYKATVVAVGNEKDGVWTAENAKVLYNSDKENIYGFGAGTEDTYPETRAGKTILAKTNYPDTNVEGRFVRIYMSGSNASYLDSGRYNHVIECAVNGYNFGPVAYNKPAFDNTGNYLDLPTHYEKYYELGDNHAAPGKHLPGQVTHPDVIKVEEGFGGHQYWMLYTPNVMMTSQFENPYIVYSDDGINWEEPKDEDGETVNPIGPRATKPDGSEGEKSHNCDTDIIYDAKNQRLMAYWNWSLDLGGADCQVRTMVSYDGIHWGAPVEGKEAEKEIVEGEFHISVRDTETKYNLLSPSITYDSHKDMYFMYYNNAGNIGYTNGQRNKVQVRYSKDGLNWSEEVRDVVNFLGKDKNGQQLAPWHQDVQYIPERNEYWAMSQCFAGSSPDGSVLYMTRSKDGLNWEQMGNQPVLSPNSAPFWNDFQIYRSTFYFDVEKETIDIWYSALQTTPADKKVADPNGELTLTAGTDDSRVWRIGHASNSMEEVFKALTKDEYYEEPGNIASRGFMLTAKDPVLEPGQSTTTTTQWSVLGGWGGGGEAAPDNKVTDMNVKYTSDNEEVATVDPWGNITAHKDGTAIISGVTREGSETEILITVGDVEKVEPRQKVSAEQPLYISNYYWSDGAPVEAIDNCDAGRNPEKNYISDELNEDGTRVDRDDPLKLWNTIPDDLKDNTVVLLIAERSIKDYITEEGTEDVNAIRTWYKKQVEFCNKNKIPCAVQNINGETSTYDRIPLSFWKELAEENEYLVGFNGAELYNRFNGGGSNNADEHVADLIRMGATLGVSMMWTDTNVFGNHGVLMDWLEEENSVLGNAMKDNSEYVSMMYKESYGNPSTDALYLGLWLAGYCDNWGVASDWWHWQLDGNQTLFNKPGSLGAWGQTLVWPENMYSQDIIRVASMGATSYKSEPQWYSVASNGNRTPAYQYSVMPTLQKLCNGEIDIPTREEVAERTKLVVKGTENFRPVIYDQAYSQLYPKTGRYGIVPLVPNTEDNEKLRELGFEVIVEEPLTEAMLQEVYPEQKYEGNAWAENYGKTWYMMNSSEDKDVRQSAKVSMKPADLTVDMAPHAYVVATEKTSNQIDLVLSNYRLDKTELWSGSPAESMSKVYQYIWEMSRRMQNNEGRDTELRETVITIHSTDKPTVEFKNTGENQYSYDNYTRPFTYSEVEGEEGNWKVKVQHNGFVECTIMTGNTVSVEYEDFEGNVESTERVLGEALGTLPEVEVPNGYVFAGWKDQDGKVVTEETVVEAGMKLVPQKEAIVITDGSVENGKGTITLSSAAVVENVEVTAKLDGTDYELSNVQFAVLKDGVKAEKGDTIQFTFDPVAKRDVEQTLEISVNVILKDSDLELEKVTGVVKIEADKPIDSEDPEDPEKPGDPENPDKPVDPENPDKPEDPKDPEKPGDPDKPKNPDKTKPSDKKDEVLSTGDAANALGVLFILGFSITVLIAAMFTKKRV